MKKLILSAMIILMMSCEESEPITQSKVIPENECLCLEIQEIKREVELFVNGEWIYRMEWIESGLVNDFEGCYTEEQLGSMVREVSNIERWYIVCENN